jgi:hypothetical protein
LACDAGNRLRDECKGMAKVYIGRRGELVPFPFESEPLALRIRSEWPDQGLGQ